MVEGPARLQLPHRAGVQGSLGKPTDSVTEGRRTVQRLPRKGAGGLTGQGAGHRRRARGGAEQQTAAYGAEGAAAGVGPKGSASAAPRPDCQAGYCLSTVRQTNNSLEALPAWPHHWPDLSCFQRSHGNAPFLAKPGLQGNCWPARGAKAGPCQTFWGQSHDSYTARRFLALEARCAETVPHEYL